MLYALIASNIAWAALAAFLVARGLGFYQRAVALADSRETAKDQNHREHVRHLEDQIVLLKVDPQVAVAKAVDTVDAPRQFTQYDDDEDLVASFKELE